MRLRLAGWWIALAPIATASGHGCTTFDDLQPETKCTTPSLQAPYLAQDQAATVCARLFQCPTLGTSIYSSISVPVGDFNYSVCMDRLAGNLPGNRLGRTLQSGILQCMVATTACADAMACLPWEEISADDPRCVGAGTGSSCIDQNKTMLDCSLLYATHCDSAYFGAGSRCMIGTDGVAACALSKDCSDPHRSCEEPMFDSCDLKSGLHESWNCNAAGHKCGVDQSTNSAECLTRTTVELCTGFDADCQGDQMLVCDDFSLSVFDCAAVCGTCAKGAGEAWCARPGDECTPVDTAVNTCEGDTIALCIEGRKVKYDCKRIGKTCKPGDASGSGHCG
ncbi:MAG: hypothetical protein HY898_10300 [Deltaproteobacteria bacterium]|nr:hypothetical protein [Deltaproteobacteria bacterium]